MFQQTKLLGVFFFMEILVAAFPLLSIAGTISEGDQVTASMQQAFRDATPVTSTAGIVDLVGKKLVCQHHSALSNISNDYLTNLVISHSVPSLLNFTFSGDRRDQGEESFAAVISPAYGLTFDVHASITCNYYHAPYTESHYVRRSGDALYIESDFTSAEFDGGCAPDLNAFTPSVMFPDSNESTLMHSAIGYDECSLVNR